MQRRSNSYLLVYDAGCGICTRFKRSIDWLDKYNRLEYCSLDKADEIGLLHSIPKNRRHRSFHLISPERELSSGADAIPIVFRLLPLGGLMAFLLCNAPQSQRILNFLYATISRLHDSGSCSYESGKSVSGSPRFTEKNQLTASSQNMLDWIRSCMQARKLSKF
jgi:predicted DCC family thiol-disulfide oxidoreductase YuxK